MNKPLHYYPLSMLMMLWISITALSATAQDTELQPKSGGQITLSTHTLPSFRSVYTGTHSDVQFYEIDATGLEENLTITATPPARISTDCYTGFVSTLSLPPHNGEIAGQRIFVRIFAENTGNFSPVISHTSGNVQEDISTSVSVTVSQIPQNYYSSATASGAELKTQLFNIINGHTTVSYTPGVWIAFETTDIRFDGKVWDIYSDKPCDEPAYIYTFGEDQDSGTGGNTEGDVYNREHSMPRSWFGGQVDPMNTDLHHIYPTDKWVNERRGNWPFGVVNSPTWTSTNGGKLGPNSAGNAYTGTAFEPIDAYKGDLARTYFYMVTRYEDQIESWPDSDMLDNNKFPGYEPWVIEMLLKWHKQDPVSHRERMRNDAIYQIQQNRNPFIDHPDLVLKIWGSDDDLKVWQDKEALDYPDFTFTGEDTPQAVTTDFTLPARGSIHNSSISWQSSHTGLVKIEQVGENITAVVTQPDISYELPQAVTLTAHLELNDAWEEKTFQVKIMPETFSYYAIHITQPEQAQVSTQPENEAPEDTPVDIFIADVVDGYYVSAVEVETAGGQAVSTTTLSTGTHYRFTMPSEDVHIAVTLTEQFSATLSPESAEFDLINPTPGDVQTTISFVDATTLTKVQTPDGALEENSHYTFSDNILSIHGSFFRDKEPGQVVFELLFDQGQPLTLTVNLYYPPLQQATLQVVDFANFTGLELEAGGENAQLEVWINGQPVDAPISGNYIHLETQTFAHGDIILVRVTSPSGSFKYYELTLLQAPTLYFVVRDADSEEPIEGANILIQNQELVTTKDGAAEIILPNGTYPFTISAEEYIDHTGEASISGENKLVEVAMEPLPFYTLTLTPVPAHGGSVQGEGQYREGTEITLLAEPAGGFLFEKWEDETGNPLSEQTEFLFTMPAEDIILIAAFVAESVDAVDVNTLADLRAMPADGTLYRYTGEAAITALDENEKWKFIQDESAALLIEDKQGIITTTYDLYDIITQLEGTLEIRNEMLVIVPTANTPVPQVNRPVTPIIMAIEDIGPAHQAMLITLEDVAFREEDTFEPSAYYSLSDGINETGMFTGFTTADYMGEEIPRNPLDITGVLMQQGAAMYLMPRFLLDFQLGTGLEDIQASFLRVFPNPASENITIEAGAPIQLITLTDMNGRRMYRSEPLQETMKLSVSQLPDGIYILHVVTAGKLHRQKIQILK